MIFLFTFLTFILGLFGGLISSTTANSQAQANDSLRKVSINTLYQELERHYNDNGEYPTLDEITYEITTTLPGIQPDAYTDPNGNYINQGDYTYQPIECTATGCAHYELYSILESETPALYSKQSLN